MSPKIIAVSRSARHGFSKTPQSVVKLIAGEGVEDDAHRGRTTQHLYRMRQDPTQPNLCQVHLLASEKLAELRAQGFDIEAGDLGENILTAGLELLTLPLGTLLYLGSAAIVEVSGLRTPCSQIDRYRKGLQQHMWGQRDAHGRKARLAGIMSVVVQGGDVYPGDDLVVQLPALPHRPLPPV